MIPFGNQSQINGKKKLNLRTYAGQFATTNKKNERPEQKQERFIKSKSLSKNLISQNIIYKTDAQQKIQRKRSLRRLTEISKSKKLFIKSMEKQNNKKIVINNKNKDEENIRILHPFSIIKNQGKRLSLYPTNISQKHQFGVIELLNFCQKNLVNDNRSDLQEHEITDNSEKSQKSNIQNLHCIKNKLSSKSSCLDKLQQFGASRFVDKSTEKKINKSTFKSINLGLSSKLLEITIPPWKKPGEKVNQQVQTVQSQTQIFEYLVYKRKKQQYEKQFMDFFSDVSMLKKDRDQCLKRRNSLFQIYYEKPQDEREKRIFQLKKDMERLQEAVQVSINEKLRKDQIQSKQIQQIQLTTLSGLTKIDETIHNYLLIFKQAFQKNQQTKYLRIVQRLENLISHTLTQANNQIDYHIKKNKSYKQQSIDLKRTFNEYINSYNQYKKLLRNCFDHLKKTPELCYELFGEKFPQMEFTLDLVNENKQFEKPKCVECFNSKWKLHTVVQQNILMKSILKVSDELLK